MPHLPARTYQKLYAACVLRQAVHLDYDAARTDNGFGWYYFLDSRVPELAHIAGDAELGDAPAVLCTRFDFLLDWPTPDPSGWATDHVVFPMPDVTALHELADLAINWPRPWLTGEFGDSLLRKGTFPAGELREFFELPDREVFRMDQLFRQLSAWA